MRTAARRAKNRAFGSWRPMAILGAGICTAWFLSASGITERGIKPLWDDRIGAKAAVTALSWEWASFPVDTPDWTTLLRLSSPLLASARPAAPSVADASVPAGALEQLPPAPLPQTSPPTATDANNVPLLVPMLTPPPEAAAASDGSEDTALATTPPHDDRVWPVPSAETANAHPVKEVTLLPSGDDTSLVRVNNDTQFSPNISKLLESASVLKPTEEGPQILILHTHGSESFLPDSRAYYIPTDIERTEDTRYNVVRLGDEMAERLTAMGLNVIHDRDIHDYPSYNGSYNRAYACIVEYIKKYPGIRMVIDLHRDSISKADGTMYKAVSQTDKGKAAQMMFVIGSNGTGLNHDNWQGNLSVAAKLQEKLLTAYPTLMRPIHLRRERFNQHATAGSMILEVGTAANALDEALLSVELFCDTVGGYLVEELK